MRDYQKSLRVKYSRSSYYIHLFTLFLVMLKENGVMSDSVLFFRPSAFMSFSWLATNTTNLSSSFFRKFIRGLVRFSTTRFPFCIIISGPWVFGRIRGKFCDTLALSPRIFFSVRFLKVVLSCSLVPWGV